jgi:hypothetical protein
MPECESKWPLSNEDIAILVATLEEIRKHCAALGHQGLVKLADGALSRTVDSR